jgi:AraC family transcriptional activator of pobA
MEDINYNLQGKAGIMLCLNGTCEALINGKPYKMHRGMTCIISPIISFLPISQSPDFDAKYFIDVLEVFYPVVRTVFDIVVKMRIDKEPCRQLNEDGIKSFLDRCQLIEQKKQVIASTEDKDTKSILEKTLKLAEQEMILDMFIMYHNNLIVEPQSTLKDEAVAIDFIYNINLNYKKERSVGFYADKAKLSIGHFSRTIKAKTGKTPSQFIATITIVNAKLMLQQPGKSIKEIAAELNFPEQFTFRKYFKKHVGMPPQEYRALKRNSRTKEQQG